MKPNKLKWFLALTAAASILTGAAAGAFAQDSTATATTTARATETVTNIVAAAPPGAVEDTNDTRVHLQDVVAIGHDVEVRKDEEAQDVVVIFGSSKVMGNAAGDVVSVFGDIDLNGEVQGNVVSVFGSVTAGSNTVVHQDVVSVGGSITREPGAKFHGRVQQTAMTLPGVGDPRWLGKWFSQCVVRLRPLTLNIAWVWVVAGVFFLVYFLIALAFPQSVRACAATLHERPITTLAAGLLGQIALVIICVLLLVTVVGILFIPFLLLGVFIAFLVGKVAILETLGGGIGKAAKVEILQRPIPAFLIGTLLVTLAYIVPILGLLTFLFVSAWGFGAAITTARTRFRRERPPKPPTAPIAPVTPPPPSRPPGYGMPATGAAMTTAAFGAAAASTATMDSTTMSAPIATTAAVAAPGAPLGESMGFVPPPSAPPLPPESSGFAPPPSAPFVAAVPAVPTALAFPRAGFWLRMGAAFLDCVLVGVLTARGGPGLFFLALTAYFAALWTWRGTSVGGIILRLQVVRADGQPLSFLVALVRALSAMFSAMVFFLGFFWIGWDLEKQGWHDKIAGTLVVRLPHAPALVCV